MKKITPLLLLISWLLFVVNSYAAIKPVTTSNFSGEGSINTALRAAVDGDTIMFDQSLKNDTVYFNTLNLNKTNLYENEKITIIGNGVTLASLRGLGLGLSYINYTIENVNFYGAHLYIDQVHSATLRNCTFSPSEGSNCNMTISGYTWDGFEPAVTFEGCVFSYLDNTATAISINESDMTAETFTTISFNSCTILKNTSTYPFIRRSQKNTPVTIRFANSIIYDESGDITAIPIIQSPAVTAQFKGYNVLRGVIDVPTIEKTTTDLIVDNNTELSIPIKLEDNVYKVLKTGKAYNNLPANTVIEGIKLPEYDILGSKIDYTKVSHSGAVQEVFTSDDASLAQLISEDGAIIDITKTYLIPQDNTNSTLVLTVETAQNAKVFVGEQELDDKELTVDISKPSVQSIAFKIVSADGTNTESYTLKVEKRFNFDDIVITRWNNTLIVNANNTTNGGFDFSGYKWYKDNAEVGTGQYYSAGSKKTDLLSGNYYLELTTKDGQVLRTWEKNIALKSSMVMKAYPNPLRAGETVSVELDIDPELLNQASIEIYNINGNSVSKTKAMGNITPVVMPSSTGMYILKVRAGDFVKEEKLMVK